MEQVNAAGEVASTEQVSDVADPSEPNGNIKVPEKYKLKVNGREIEKSVDELIRDAQLGISADEKFKKASTLEKKYSQYEQMERAMESGDFTQLIGKIGPDKFREIAENYLIDYLEYQQLSPEKKEALQYKKSYEEAKNKLESKEKQEQEQEMARVKNQAIQEIDEEIAQILKESGKKPRPHFVARIAEQMLASLQTRSVDPKSAAKSAYNKAISSVHEDVAEYLSEMTADEARKVLPKALLDALRMSDVEAVRSQDPMRSRSNVKTETKSRNDGKKFRGSTEEFFKQLEKNL